MLCSRGLVQISVTSQWYNPGWISVWHRLPCLLRWFYHLGSQSTAFLGITLGFPFLLGFSDDRKPLLIYVYIMHIILYVQYNIVTFAQELKWKAWPYLGTFPVAVPPYRFSLIAASCLSYLLFTNLAVMTSLVMPVCLPVGVHFNCRCALQSFLVTVGNCFCSHCAPCSFQVQNSWICEGEIWRKKAHRWAAGLCCCSLLWRFLWVSICPVFCPSLSVSFRFCNPTDFRTMGLKIGPRAQMGRRCECRPYMLKSITPAPEYPYIPLPCCLLSWFFGGVMLSKQDRL